LGKNVQHLLGNLRQLGYFTDREDYIGRHLTGPCAWEISPEEGREQERIPENGSESKGDHLAIDSASAAPHNLLAHSTSAGFGQEKCATRRSAC
jgi:hypothetical protein